MKVRGLARRMLPAGCILAAGLLSGCHRDMYEQPKFLPDQQARYFPGVTADRLPPPHTIPHDAADGGTAFATGENAGVPVEAIPEKVTAGILARGREEFEINCSVCHGRDGYGQGMIVQRGFPPPPSFHSDHLRTAPAGHFFQVITNGYGAMYPFGSRIAPDDRWAIVSYIRALQFSQDAPAGSLDAADQAKLGGTR